MTSTYTTNAERSVRLAVANGPLELSDQVG